jgi:uncharacterized membrane protein YfcA
MSPESPLLFLAGFLGGMLNSIAGGGTFITFPALLLAGVPPVSANATNTFASCSGYLSGAYAFRNELRLHAGELPKFISVGVAGGAAGAWLLLQTPEALFREAIPWLLLLATFLFVFGDKLNKTSRRLATRHRRASYVGKTLLFLLLTGVCIYGGFFNAGLGIVILSYLALAGHTDINTMNGLKLLVSSCVSLIAIALFIHEGVIAWSQGIMVLIGTLVGGYLAARVSRKIPQHFVRGFVVFASVVITAYFFHDTYPPR